MQRLDTGCAVQAEGVLVARPGRGGASTGEGAREELELHVDSWRIVGGVGTTAAGEPYPLAKKRHSLEHLRSFLHLRPRTKSLGATMRVRSALAHAVHDFFRQREFELVHTPVITASDCEGAGELFQVEAVDGDDHGDQAAPERPHHFFGEPTFLTVSGQMSAEAYACAMGNVYTFGPAFRAERSHTVRHLAEFYMIEPEMAFAGLSDVVANARDLLVHCVRTALRDHGEHIEFLQQQYHRWEEEQQQRQGKKASNSKKKRHLHQLTKSSPQQNMEFLERIQSSSNSRSNVFVTMTYAEAVGMLQGAIAKDRSKWQFPDLLVGDALQTEHEQWLARECGHAVVFVTDYPAGIKPFYMRGNDDDARSVVPTVACMDMLVPRIGELAGGSAREERLNVLQQQMQSHGLDPNSPAYEWYLDLRRFGTVPHAGYGMGFERLVCLVTGARNIRDVIPFPRFENHAVG